MEVVVRVIAFVLYVAFTSAYCILKNNLVNKTRNIFIANIGQMLSVSQAYFKAP